MKLSGWIPDPNCNWAYMRIIENGNPNDISCRVAFIEKTPRIRIRPIDFLNLENDWENWEYGNKGSGDEYGYINQREIGVIKN